MKTALRPLLSFLIVALAMTAAPARAVSPAVWTLTVPAPTTPSTSSTLDSITSDSLGDAFVVIALTNTSNAGGIPLTLPAGSQLFLLNPKGKIVGTAEVSESNLTPIFVAAKRAIVTSGSSILQFTANAQGALVSSTLSTQTAGEALFPSEPLNQEYKYLHTTLSTNNFISTVKRYLVTKLVP